jgi:NAD(P)-dependent dehydrogenase (short-subunit alcohol dehydrogenase family)
MTNALANQIAVVTGGSQGLGQAITAVLSAAGATVIIGDVKVEQASQQAAALTQQDRQVTARRLDLLDPGSIGDFVNAVVGEYGRVDILINNAGTDVTKPVEELTVEEWDRVLGVNLRGVFLMAQAVLPMMYRQGGGHIVNITSTAAKRAWPNASAYHASKWGVLGLSYALFAEARQQGVKVTAVAPGGMRTPFLLDRFPDIDPNNLQDPHTVAQTILHVLTLPPESVIPEVMVLPMCETSWP